MPPTTPATGWCRPTAPDAYCVACRHNRTVPDLARPQNLLPWRKLEAAKHRLFYTLLRLNLPHRDPDEDPEHGLAFDFLADPPAASGPKVMTGHDNGLITIALAEADDAEREKRRAAMGEPYRTLLGHFRHEVGHYYWDRLVRDGGPARRLPGGVRRRQPGLRRRRCSATTRRRAGRLADAFISAYATTHPWEDFAETWAHYLHIVDTLETAARLRPAASTQGSADERRAGRRGRLRPLHGRRSSSG